MPVVASVRLRFIAKDYWFDPNGVEVHEGDHVLVDTERGREMVLGKLGLGPSSTEAAYGSAYNTAWKNAREMYDGNRSATKNLSERERAKYVMEYLNSFTTEQLSNAGLDMIMESLGL